MYVSGNAQTNYLSLGKKENNSWRLECLCLKFLLYNSRTILCRAKTRQKILWEIERLNGTKAIRHKKKYRHNLVLLTNFQCTHRRKVIKQITVYWVGNFRFGFVSIFCFFSPFSKQRNTWNKAYYKRFSSVAHWNMMPLKCDFFQTKKNTVHVICCMRTEGVILELSTIVELWFFVRFASF